MEDNFNKHLGNKLKLRRLALGLTQTKVAKAGMTMIVVTHEMGFAKEVADEVIFMDEGMIVEKAATKEFFANPKSDRTKLFLSQIL